MEIALQLIYAARKLRDSVNKLSFSLPITHVYNPLVYAWEAHKLYLENFGKSTKKVIFLGMNPGPFGMAQTGVPFGEISAVRDWMNIEVPIAKPPVENPKRPVEGFNCPRSEVSGRRLWGLMEKRFQSPNQFFEDHLIFNYCPLVFMEASGRNVTPDKIPLLERKLLNEACDEHLRQVVSLLDPGWCIGVGGFARKCFERVIPDHPKLGTLLHPSPASPAANLGWEGKAVRQLTELGVW
ncbi:MAG: single-stranded DNA-binding protein [Opitutaceae bacterium]|nr:single-stranded DNA-binding protein [Opitutaceae bacterium]|tara:strand:+ start:13353 stop:14069 length:717 start_codon:yes stop_codon:yes gene_type:complete